MNKYYTGVGSRDTPLNILSIMTKFAKKLEESGWILRSGGAEGADQAFELGTKTLKEIFLPWKNFQNNPSPHYKIPIEAFIKAEQIHPAWQRCSQGAQKLHARNIQQVLGKKLNEPSKFLICWTKGGISRGGTATAINLAIDNGVKVINLGNEKHLQKILSFLNK